MKQDHGLIFAIYKISMYKENYIGYLKWWGWGDKKEKDLSMNCAFRKKQTRKFIILVLEGLLIILYMKLKMRYKIITKINTVKMI